MLNDNCSNPKIGADGSQMRNIVRSLDHTNAATIEMIEAAAFVVCLDDGSSSTPTERCNRFFLGDPSNRWSDKNLQFIVCENGVSAFVGEHTMLDGMSVRLLNIFITRAILEQQSKGELIQRSCNDVPGVLDDKASSRRGSLEILSGGLVAEYTFNLTTTIEKRVSMVQERFRHQFEPIELTHYNVESYGQDFLRKHKCRSKSAYQMVIQLACYLFYGHNPPSWETISMSRFRKGRIDWIQAVQPEIAQFCIAACDDQLSVIERCELFYKAVMTHTVTATQIARGHGFKAHLHALLAVLKDGEPVPKIFQNQSWEATRVQSVKIVKTDCLEDAMLQETAFLLAYTECIFVHFEVKDDQ